MDGVDVLRGDEQWERPGYGFWANKQFLRRLIRVIHKIEIVRKGIWKPASTDVGCHILSRCTSSIFPMEGESHTPIQYICPGFGRPGCIELRYKDKGSLNYFQTVSVNPIRLNHLVELARVNACDFYGHSEDQNFYDKRQGYLLFEPKPHHGFLMMNGWFEFVWV